LGAIQSVAPSFGVELGPLNMRDAPEIERRVTAFARSANEAAAFVRWYEPYDARVSSPDL